MATHEKKAISLTGIFLKQNGDEGYTTFFAEFPEVIAEGDTREEAEKNLFDALQIMMEIRKEGRNSYDEEDGIEKTTFELELI